MKDPKKTILIIDDDKKGVENLVNALEKFHCVVVDEIEEAFETMQEVNPHLVVLDLNLPLRFGFEFLSEKMSHSVFSKIPTLVYVDQADEIKQLRGFALGATAYIKRPCRVNEILSQVKKLLKDPSFKQFIPSQEWPTRCEVEASGWVKMLSEAAFVIESPIKMARNEEAKVDCPVFIDLEIADTIMKTNKRKSFQVSTGVFSSEVNFVGIDEKTSKRIERLVSHWKEDQWYPRS